MGPDLLVGSPLITILLIHSESELYNVSFAAVVLGT